VHAVLAQPKGAGGRLSIRVNHALKPSQRTLLISMIRRMLRLDESRADLDSFHALDPRWKESGRGRIFRSPTLFEDVLKTVTSCNVTWPGTLHMNHRLCETLGPPVRLDNGEIAHGFPSPRKLARTRPATLRARCRVGYRDVRIVELAKLFAHADTPRGIQAHLLEDPAQPESTIRSMLMDLPGVGPYAANNILQLLGRYGHVPLDTESVRHGRNILNFPGTPAQVMKRVKEHFARFGDQAFRSYWFELWSQYEAKHGPAWTWERDSTGKLFVADST
jgi:3-methyladenine DNA glycosylase/8-oxoguanine DNA glycosylase